MPVRTNKVTGSDATGHHIKRYKKSRGHDHNIIIISGLRPSRLYITYHLRLEVIAAGKTINSVLNRSRCLRSSNDLRLDIH